MRLFGPVNMRRATTWFNPYLGLCLALGVLVGCQSPQSRSRKEISTLRVHLEVRPEPTGQTETVTLLRDNPITLTIEKSPFLTEVHVASAKLVEAFGVPAIQVQLDRSGTWLLEQYTTAYRGRRMVIFSQFGEQPNQARWLAAPLIKQRIGDGFLVFTPDASREEAERIVRGLNNLVAQRKKRDF
jgi:preprotein translocase subunit SecD